MTDAPGTPAPSMGGVVAVLAASRHPDLARRVTLAASALPRAGSGPVDPIIPESSARAFIGHHPSWTHIELDGVGHVPPLEAPRATADTIAA